MTQPTPPVFSLPAALSSCGYGLRPETEDDLPFLLRLYGSTREEELKAIPWSAEQKQAFLASQFQAQRHHYTNYIPACTFEVLTLAGEPVGRLYLEPRQGQLYIVDIALMPERRGQGLGSAIMRALQATARLSGRGVGIMVEKFNPALRLYRRLGFTDVADHEVYLEMEWRPQGDQLNVA
jgi:ribosomal protein S18 acetylase RimI-like enzyme